MLYYITHQLFVISSVFSCKHPNVLLWKYLILTTFLKSRLVDFLFGCKNMPFFIEIRFFRENYIFGDVGVKKLNFQFGLQISLEYTILKIPPSTGKNNSPFSSINMRCSMSVN